MSRPLRVLFVGRSEVDPATYVRELERHEFEPFCTRVETREAMETSLAHTRWDLVIAANDLPRFPAPEALALLRSKGIDIPFLLSSESIPEEAAMEALKAGADDFITKNDLTRLVPAIQREASETAGHCAPGPHTVSPASVVTVRKPVVVEQPHRWSTESRS